MPRLEALLQIVDDCSWRLPDAGTTPNQLPTPIRVILERSLGFARQNIETIAWLLAKGLYPPGAILVRSLFELGARILWASRAENGWERYQAEGASEYLNWAEKAKNVPRLASEVTRILASPDIRARCEGARRMPKVRAMLSEIDETDRECGSPQTGNPGDAVFFYLAVYALYSQSVHAHPVFIGLKQSPPLVHSLIGSATYGVFMIVRGVYYTLGWHFDGLWKEFMQLLKDAPERGTVP
jgi:hypothetical protein